MIRNFSPAQCELIYRTRQREMLREKLMDLHITTIPHVENATEAYRDLQQNLRRLISGKE